MKNALKIIETASVLVVSTAMIMYGIGKVVQFPLSVAETRKISELSGQELMWAFYGHSKTFPIILGILETMGGVLLLFKKTRLIATVLLSTILVNVILQDVIYNVNRGALIAAIIYQVLIIGILAINGDRVIKILRLMTETQKDGEKENFKNKVLTTVYIGLAFVILKGFEYIITH